MIAEGTGATVGEAGESTATSVEATSAPNLHRWERIGSAVIGGLLLRRGLRGRSLRSIATAAVGAGLCYRAATGRSRLSRSLGIDTERSVRGVDDGDVDVEDVSTVSQSVTVGASADELTALVEDPETLDRIVGPVATVTAAGEDHHQWEVEGPFGRRFGWETRLEDTDDGETLHWKTVGEPTLSAECTLSFEPAPGDRGTKTTLDVRLDPPGGDVGRTVANTFDIVSASLLSAALDRFKSLAETGEIPTTASNPSARGSGDLV